ncbi:unnamed protein product [Closterium sp. NIES-54]
MRCPARARPSSPFDDLRTVLLRLSPRRPPPQSVLPSPPESSLTSSTSTPITNYYRATRPVVTRVLASLVTDPRASPSSVSALSAMVAGLAAARRLEYATRVVAARPLSTGEMGPWRSTGTYVDAVPPHGANVVDGMWIFKVKRPPGSPPVFNACYVARGFSQREGVGFFQTFAPTPKMTTLRVLLHVVAQRDSELHSLNFSTAFLQGSMHEEIWHPVSGHDMLRTTLAALGFRPSSTDPSLFVRSGPTPFFVLVYVDDLVFATADRNPLAELKSELQKRHTCTDLGELRRYLSLQITRDRASHTITLTQSHMVRQVLQGFGLQHSTTQPTPLAIDHRLTGPFLDKPFESSGTQPVVRTSHCYSSYADDVETQRSTQGYCFSLGAGGVSWWSTRSSSVASSSAETEIYAGAMAVQELRWLTFLLTDLGERPSSAPTLFADNKAGILLCQEPRLESRVKHIDVWYFLLRELQRRGQAPLDFVASEANTADIFTKALPPGDHRRFYLQLGLVDVGSWLQ